MISVGALSVLVETLEGETDRETIDRVVGRMIAVMLPRVAGIDVRPA